MKSSAERHRKFLENLARNREEWTDYRGDC